MEYLIAPTLFQNKTCRLPGIGQLAIVTHPAKTDFANMQILAPTQAIVFTATKDDEDVFDEFSALSKLIKKDLDEKGFVNIQGVGAFLKNEEGVVSFKPQQINQRFTPAVFAEQVDRVIPFHAIQIGDKVTPFVLPTIDKEQESFAPIKKSRWWIWALLLATIGAAVIGYYFFRYGFNALGNMGNF